MLERGDELQAGSDAAGGNPVYEIKTIYTVRGLEARAIAKWQAAGWEFTGKTHELLRTKLAFRRVKPKQPKWVWIAGIAALVVLGIIIAVNASLGASRTAGLASSPTQTPFAQTSAFPSESPTPEPEPEPSGSPEGPAVTEAEIVSALRAFIDERAASGVVLASTVTDITFREGVVRVTFDPIAAGIDQQSFDAINSYDNLARFMSTPIAFNNDLGNRLRPSILAIETNQPDGSSLGTLTATEILALNELQR